MSNDHLDGTQNGLDGAQNGLDGTQNGAAGSNGQRAVRLIDEQAAALRREWATDSRWAGVDRSYSAADV
ncbi:MAG: hypothetical protein ABSA03_12415, partial [Streptosporangiaceae bacterium]